MILGRIAIWKKKSSMFLCNWRLNEKYYPETLLIFLQSLSWVNCWLVLRFGSCFSRLKCDSISSIQPIEKSEKEKKKMGFQSIFHCGRNIFFLFDQFSVFSFIIIELTIRTVD